MKITRLTVVFASALILAIVFISSGNVFAEEHEHYQEKESDEEYHHHYSQHQLVGQVYIYFYFDKEPTYYDKALLITNGVKERFDFEADALEYGNGFKKPYYFYGYQPEKFEICVINLDSDRNNCVNGHDSDSRVTLYMPD